MEEPAGALDPFLPPPPALLKEPPPPAMADPTVAQVATLVALMWSSSDPQQPLTLMAGTPTASSW
jgi:hypothetical protein